MVYLFHYSKDINQLPNTQSLGYYERLFWVPEFLVTIYAVWRVPDLLSISDNVLENNAGKPSLGYMSSSGFMAPHSSTLAWKSHGQRSLVGCSPWGRWVGHDWTTSLWHFTFMHWRRKWQPTPVFLPGESQGRGSLVGCRLWGHTELDTTEAT